MSKVRGLPNRRHAIHEACGPFVVTFGYDPRTDELCEVFISARGKSGHDLDDLLYDLGVSISRAIQRR